MFKIIALCALVGIASALSPQALSYKRPAQRRPAAPAYQAAPAYHAPAAHQNAAPAHHSSSDDVHAEVKNLQQDVRADGYDFAFDTTNNIHVASYGDEQGNMHGDYSYYSPEGVLVQLSYVADENGYQPSSNLLPTPPPIPEAILRSLEYIRTHSAQEPQKNYYKKRN